MREKVSRWVLTIISFVFVVIATRNIENISDLSGASDVFRAIYNFTLDNVLFFLSGFAASLSAVMWVLLARKKSRACVKLMFTSNNVVPCQIDSDNVFRWYSLKNYVRFVAPDGFSEQCANTIVYISFQMEICPNFCDIFSTDFVVPKYEVKDFTSRYLIIVFEGDIPPGMLQIVAREK